MCLWCVVAMHATAGQNAFATPPDDGVVVRRSRNTGLASFLTARDGGPIDVDARVAPPLVGGDSVRGRAERFLRQYGPLFGVTDPARELVRIHRQADALGHTHVTYRQTHKGVRVFSGLLKVHEDARERVVAANGDVFIINSKLNTEPTLTADEAAAIALDQIDEGDPDVNQSKLVIVDPGWYGDPPIGEHLAYHVIVSDGSVSLRDALFVDAHTGEVLDRWSMIQRSKDRKIYNAFNTSELPGIPARFEDDPPSSDDDVNRAYDYLGDAYDYFSRAFGRDSIDDAGLSLIATVNSEAVGLYCPNAQWRGGSLQMLLCQGLATDDIVAHELMHGITQFTANLIYQNQSGQLNESYSDIFGELVDLFNGDAAWAGSPGGTPWPTDLDYADSGSDTPNMPRTGSCLDPAVRWRVGEDWQIIRDMWNPPCEGQPDRAFSSLQTCGGPSGADNGGVHSGSGIPNHAFAMMTDGKSFNGFDVTAIGPIKAAAVWYRALTVYLTPASDFEDAYYALNQAALDLIGTIPNDPRTGGPSESIFTAEDAAEVDKALIAVEMNSEGRCGATVPILDDTPPQQCPPRVTLYRADFEDGASAWTTSITAGHPPTPYQWVLRGDLPFGRSGTTFYGEDRDVGDCTPASDESAVHTLFSPVIDVPAGMADLRLVFTHYVATETGWDGGNLNVSVNGGNWQSVPESAFLHNPYNLRLNSAPQGNSNPLRGQLAYSGAGGGWGTTLIDLSALLVDVQTIQVRFNLGKDGCVGVDGWYIDDFEVYHCAKCPEGDIQWVEPQDGVIDARQARSIEDGSPQGIDNIVALGPSGAEPGCWSLCETATDGTANFVAGSSELDPGTYLIELDRPLTPGAVTKITYTSGAGVVTAGAFISLPGDSNGDTVSNTADIANLADCCLDGACSASPEAHACDMDRSETVTAEDLLRQIDLFNGAGQFSKSWDLESPRDGGECQ
jgi:Zn-dependent metalloprotease